MIFFKILILSIIGLCGCADDLQAMMGRTTFNRFGNVAYRAGLKGTLSTTPNTVTPVEGYKNQQYDHNQIFSTNQPFVPLSEQFSRNVFLPQSRQTNSFKPFLALQNGTFSDVSGQNKQIDFENKTEQKQVAKKTDASQSNQSLQIPIIITQEQIRNIVTKLSPERRISLINILSNVPLGEPLMIDRGFQLPPLEIAPKDVSFVLRMLDESHTPTQKTQKLLTNDSVTINTSQPAQNISSDFGINTSSGRKKVSVAPVATIIEEEVIPQLEVLETSTVTKPLPNYQEPTFPARTNSLSANSGQIMSTSQPTRVRKTSSEQSSSLNLQPEEMLVQQPEYASQPADKLQDSFNPDLHPGRKTVDQPVVSIVEELVPEQVNLEEWMATQSFPEVPNKSFVVRTDADRTNFLSGKDSRIITEPERFSKDQSTFTGINLDLAEPEKVVPSLINLDLVEPEKAVPSFSRWQRMKSFCTGIKDSIFSKFSIKPENLDVQQDAKIEAIVDTSTQELVDLGPKATEKSYLKAASDMAQRIWEVVSFKSYRNNGAAQAVDAV